MLVLRVVYVFYLHLMSVSYCSLVDILFSFSYVFEFTRSQYARVKIFVYHKTTETPKRQKEKKSKNVKTNLK